MISNKILGFTLALLISAGAVGCTANTPGGTASNNNTGNTAGTTQATVSAEAKSALTAYLDDQATFADSETLAAEADAGFSVKSFSLNHGVVGHTDSGEVNITAGARLDGKVEAAKAAGIGGSITKNADGTVTVDTAKVRANLKAVKVVAQDKIQKLRRKNNVVRTSDVDTVTNSDGSITKTMTVEFTNERAGITRNVLISKTTMNNKLVSSTHDLSMTTKAFTKTSKKVVTVNADGSRKAVIDVATTWTNGKKRVLHEDRTVNADGSATGTGTLTITDKDGQSKTMNLSTTATAAGATTATATDSTSNAVVKVEETASGEVTATTTENGVTSAPETVNVEAAVEASAAVTV